MTEGYSSDELDAAVQEYVETTSFTPGEIRPWREDPATGEDPDDGDVVQKADKDGRYVTPFVSFDQHGNAQLQLIASLNASRLATWGFTAEAEVRGIARYRVTSVLDGRTSEFCRLIDGRIFEVVDARKKVIEVLEVQNPDDLKTVQPWPKQTQAAIAEYKEMTNDELTMRGLHIPPYHPNCRTLLKPVVSSAGQLKEPAPTIPSGAMSFQAVTAEDLAELGVTATDAELALWNSAVGQSPVEVISRLSGISPQKVMTNGVGADPILFGPEGITIKAKGTTAEDVSFKIGTILDPFTGTYYLTQADLEAGTPKAEQQFLKRLFSALLDTSTKAGATSLAVNVANNAAYYAKLGFLPDALEWEALASKVLVDLQSGSLKEVFDSFDADDQQLVTNLLQDKQSAALGVLVDLPLTYQGKTLGEYILEGIGGTWEMDLLDADVIDQAKGYLS